MNIVIDHTKVEELARAYRQGYRRCLSDFGKNKQFISIREAKRRYTGLMVDKWIDGGFIIPKKMNGSINSKALLEVERLEILQASTLNPCKKQNLKYKKQ
jgi:hypothetical protein